MSFFDDLPEPEPEPDRTRPAWSGVPVNELGVGVPVRVVIVRSDTIALSLDSFVAYSTGVAFTLTGRVRPGAGRDLRSITHEVFSPHRQGRSGLLLGVQLVDGSRSTGGHLPPDDGDGAPRGPLLAGHGGHGGGLEFAMQYWLWPLPPPGPITFVCQWESEGIDETRAVIDAAPTLEAALRSEQLWPENEGAGGGSWGILGPG
jgi:hypothetical protein